MEANQSTGNALLAAALLCSFVVLLGGCPTTPPTSGGCTADTDCDDSNACTADTCDTAAGTCAHTATDTPVTVTAGVDGDATPNATLTASAEVTICDGSTVQSYAWTQANSVAVAIAGADTASATLTLPDVAAYKGELVTVLAESPITADQLPENVPLPEGEFPGGLQNRFQVVGINPFSLEEAGLVTLSVEVATTSGTYSDEVEVHASLPWAVAAGIRNVPLGVPVLLHGKTQDTYDWSLTGPAGATASLTDAATQSPYFTPDVSGAYSITVTDFTADPPADVTIDLFAGTWTGVVTGQDVDGRPQADNCTGCHNGSIAADTFTPWAQTGHAEIFTTNLDTSTHYSTACLSCHSVGYDPSADNGGFDDADDFAAFLDEFTADGSHFDPDENNWANMLANEPVSAQLANIQCENCHGPQGGGAHMSGDSRIDLSSAVCATCHGEPLRHARFQQWQLSAHANYELAIDEADSGSCSRCHTANGFLAWLPILLDDDPETDPTADVEVTWTADAAHPQTCVTCHDPHAIGSTTGIDTNATVRISGDTPELIAGFTATGVGRGAICMTCHNSRRGLRNDDTFSDTLASGDASRAPHGSSQTDVLMGENAYFVTVGTPGAHAAVEDACVNCHMEQTPPPDLLAYNLGGTNHTFFARADICATCHGDSITADMTQGSFGTKSEELKGLIEGALLNLIAEQIDSGSTVDLNGEAVIASTDEIAFLDFGEYHGRQAVTVNFADGTVVGPVAVNSVNVLDGDGAELGELYDFASDEMIKAGWNYNLGQNDRSMGVHNPSFVTAFLDAAIAALQ